MKSYSAASSASKDFNHKMNFGEIQINLNDFNGENQISTLYCRLYQVLY